MAGENESDALRASRARTLAGRGAPPPWASLAPAEIFSKLFVTLALNLTSVRMCLKQFHELAVNSKGARSLGDRQHADSGAFARVHVWAMHDGELVAVGLAFGGAKGIHAGEVHQDGVAHLDTGDAAAKILGFPGVVLFLRAHSRTSCACVASHMPSLASSSK